MTHIGPFLCPRSQASFTTAAFANLSNPYSSHSQPAFQAAVAPAQEIEGVALAVRSFFSMCQGRITLASRAFFDLQAAFHQELRQTLVPSTESDVELLRLLNLPVAALHELREQLTKTAQLPAPVAVVPDITRSVLGNAFA